MRRGDLHLTTRLAQIPNRMKKCQSLWHRRWRRFALFSFLRHSRQSHFTSPLRNARGLPQTKRSCVSIKAGKVLFNTTLKPFALRNLGNRTPPAATSAARLVCISRIRNRMLKMSTCKSIVSQLTVIAAKLKLRSPN